MFDSNLVHRTVARVINRHLREQDMAARYGGEEFVVILPGTDASHATELAQELCQSIASQRITGDHECIMQLTASLGHATFPIHASAADSLLKAADLALYAAKRAGRNRVVAYTLALLDRSETAPGQSPEKLTAPLTLPSGADLDMVQALITAIDLRDGYTAAHSTGVARYAKAIAVQLGLSNEQAEALHLGGLIYDIGKIGIPDSILRKPGKFTPEEWAQMQLHPLKGEHILQSVESLAHLLPLVRWHHERLDGSGYPDGLIGDAIPLLVRIISVADVFEAYTAERPYHPGRSVQEGMHLLECEAQQGHLDSHIVAAFRALLVTQGLLTPNVEKVLLQEVA